MAGIVMVWPDDAGSDERREEDPDEAEGDVAHSPIRTFLAALVRSGVLIMNESHEQLRFQRDGDDLLIFVKAVPGASQDAIAGLVGDRLKVRVAAAPEGGKANKAICSVIARKLGVKSRTVSVEAGRTSAEKTVRIRGADERAVETLTSS